MAKVKKAFFCQNCGSQHTQWQGQCSACKEWNTLVEEIIEKETTKQWLTKSVNEIINNKKLANKLANNGYKKFQKFYTEKAFVRNILAIYTKVLEINK